MKGFKQLCLLVCAGLVGALIGILATSQVSNLSATETTTHGHTLYAYTSQKATCTTNGSRAYWYCPQCDLRFSDADGLVEINANEFRDWVTIKALGHQTNENYHTYRQAATCATTGNIEYYVCMNGCGGYFTDAKCKIEIKDKNITLPKLKNHDLSKVVAVSAKAATCTEPGHEAHYTCTTCHGTFRDPSCTQPKNVTITVDHITDQTHFVDYQPATCLTAGQKPHYDCINCGEHFADSNCHEVITDIIIPQKDHSSYEVFYTAAQAPTCETAGHHGYYTCQNGCGQKFRDLACEEMFTETSIIIEPTKHNTVLTKIDPSQTAQYIKVGGEYHHGYITYKYVCVNENCEGYHKTKDYCGFGYYDQYNNAAKVTASIKDDNGIYDSFVLDWTHSDKITDASGTYTMITLRAAGIYADNATYLDHNGVAHELQPMIEFTRMKLVITAEQVTANEDVVWQFDWDGDGNYEQTIIVSFA